MPSTFVVTVRCTSSSARPGLRCAATWNTTSGRTAWISSSMRSRSRTSSSRYSAPGCRGCPVVRPRLTLTSRLDPTLASWLIRAEPMHPVPPVTRTVASRSQSISKLSGRQRVRCVIAWNRAYSSPAPPLAAMSCSVRSCSSSTTAGPRLSCPGGAAARILSMISRSVPMHGLLPRRIAAPGCLTAGGPVLVARSLTSEPAVAPRCSLLVSRMLRHLCPLTPLSVHFCRQVLGPCPSTGSFPRSVSGYLSLTPVLECRFTETRHETDLLTNSNIPTSHGS